MSRASLVAPKNKEFQNDRNAARYRVWLQIVGVDTDFHAAATVTDSDATLTALPTGKTVKIRVTALNDAGESTTSAEVEAVVG